MEMSAENENKKQRVQHSKERPNKFVEVMARNMDLFRELLFGSLDFNDPNTRKAVMYEMVSDMLVTTREGTICPETDTMMRMMRHETPQRVSMGWTRELQSLPVAESWYLHVEYPDMEQRRLKLLLICNELTLIDGELPTVRGRLSLVDDEYDSEEVKSLLNLTLENATTTTTTVQQKEQACHRAACMIIKALERLARFYKELLDAPSDLHENLVKARKRHKNLVDDRVNVTDGGNCVSVEHPALVTHLEMSESYQREQHEKANRQHQKDMCSKLEKTIRNVLKGVNHLEQCIFYAPFRAKYDYTTPTGLKKGMSKLRMRRNGECYVVPGRQQRGLAIWCACERASKGIERVPVRVVRREWKKLPSLCKGMSNLFSHQFMETAAKREQQRLLQLNAKDSLINIFHNDMEYIREQAIQLKRAAEDVSFASMVVHLKYILALNGWQSMIWCELPPGNYIEWKDTHHKDQLLMKLSRTVNAVENYRFVKQTWLATCSD